MCFVSISMSSVCLREVTYNLKRCKMVAAVLIVLPLLFLACGECAEHPHAVLQRVVEALEKLVGFYKASYTDMNLDGVYGLKVLEGLTHFHFKSFFFFSTFRFTSLSVQSLENFRYMYAACFQKSCSCIPIKAVC